MTYEAAEALATRLAVRETFVIVRLDGWPKGVFTVFPASKPLPPDAWARPIAPSSSPIQGTLF